MVWFIIPLQIAFFGFLGLIYWAASVLPIVIREIALNTRDDAGSGDSYKLVDVLAVLMKVAAVLIWVAGLVVIIITIAAPGSVDRMPWRM